MSEPPLPGASSTGGDIAWRSALEAVVRSHRIGLGVIDRELRYVRVNDHLAAMQGRTVAAYPGRTLSEALPDLAERLVPTLERVLATGRGVIDQRMRDGARTLSVSYLPIREGDVVTGAALVLTEASAGESSEALLDRLRFEETLSSVSAMLLERPSPDLDEGLAVALGRLGEALEADGAAVYELRRHMDGKLRLDRRQGWARPGHERDDPASIEVLPASWAEEGLAHDRAVAYSRLEDFPAEAATSRALLEAVGGKALIAVPLRTREGEPLGVLGFHTVRERDWSEPILPRLRLVGEVFSSALARQRGEDDARARLGFEGLLTSIARILADVPVDDVDAQIERVLGMVCAATDCARAVVVRFHGPERFTVTHRFGDDDVLFGVGDEGRFSDVGIELDELLTRGRRVWRAEDLPEEAAPLRALFDRTGFVAMISVPLSLQGSAIAALVLFSTQPRYDVDQLVARGDVIADLLAAALARRDAELARRAAFDEVRRLTEALERERDYLREEIGGDHDVRDLMGESSAIQRVREAIDAVAPTSTTVLVRGESGVGKELVARTIHQRSARAGAPLVKVSCASIPHELFESTFFGHVRGSIASAHEDRPGRFELADEATIFLDEVGEIPLTLQAKLLRVLSEGTLERVGDDQTRRVDVRVIAATNRDLAREVEAGTFRRDLYFRLSAFPIEVPPLRARAEDIVSLARVFLERAQHALGRSGLLLDAAAARRLESYAWPGNVRELMHVIERAVLLSPAPPLRIDLALPVAREDAPVETASGVKTVRELREIERRNMELALEEAGGQIAGRGGAAERLGVSPSTLRDRMRSFGLRDRKR